jgi:hypothetical protein
MAAALMSERRTNKHFRTPLKKSDPRFNKIEFSLREMHKLE